MLFLGSKSYANDFLTISLKQSELCFHKEGNIYLDFGFMHQSNTEVR